LKTDSGPRALLSFTRVNTGKEYNKEYSRVKNHFYHYSTFSSKFGVYE